MKLSAKMRALISHGDAAKIAALNPDIHYQTIRTALNAGEASDKVYPVIAAYFRQKAEWMETQTEIAIKSQEDAEQQVD